MDKKYCAVDGCDRLRAGKKEYCLAHFRQIKKHGAITNAEIKVRDKTRECKVDGCDEHHYANGYCHRHFAQFRRHGKILYINRVNSPSTGVKKKSGYFYVLKKDHPRADKRGYVKRSWLVWEESTGHIVTPPEVIHHKNGIKTDDRFENLKLLADKTAHAKEHGGRIGGIRIVTKDMVVRQMIAVSRSSKKPLTIRRFIELSGISGTAIKKFGWNALKEELCIS